MTLATIVARNYLAHARVLARSYAEHHAGRLIVLVIDAEIGDGLDASAEPFEVVVPSQLPLDPREFRLMATIYDPTELATAVKPALLLHLLERDEPVCYLDPDIEIFAPLDELGSLAAEKGIVLTPHALEPLPEDGRKPTPDDIADAGVFNLGFICVDADARPLLEWWGERLRRDCLIDFEHGMFVDQRLLDFVPAFARHHVLRDHAYNVAYWNLHERDVTWRGDRYEVGDEPLRFFHFSGYDPERPDVLSKHGGDRPRILLEERPGVARLCEHYRVRLLDEGYAGQIALTYGFANSASGRPLDRLTRRLYRQALLDGLEVPDAFDAGEAERFEAWRRGADALDEPLAVRERAAALLARGNELVSPRPWVRPFHTAILRLLSHHDLHQRRVDAALLESITQLEKRVRRLSRNGRDLS